MEFRRSNGRNTHNSSFSSIPTRETNISTVKNNRNNDRDPKSDMVTNIGAIDELTEFFDDGENPDISDSKIGISKNDKIFTSDEFQDKLDVDWDAMNLTEEAALQILPTNHSIETPLVELGKRDAHSLEFDLQENVIKKGCLERIISSSRSASTNEESDPKAFPQSDDQKKHLVQQFLKFLDFGDADKLAILIRDNCSTNCTMRTPELLEPITNKGDIMMWFSLSLEAYPDGVWHSKQVEVVNGVVTCRCHFTGTKVFNYPLDRLFQLLREQTNSFKFTGSDNMLGTETNVVDKLAGICKMSLLNDVAILKREESTGALSRDNSSISNSSSETYLREIGRTMKTVINNNGMEFERKVKFHFDALDQLIEEIDMEEYHGDDFTITKPEK